MNKPSRPALDLSVNCACGAVRLAVNGQVRAMLLCSCLECQKASGTGHSAVFMAAASDVRVTGPLKTFSRPADSGATFTRCFCPACGTPLYGSSSRAPGVLMLPIGLFAGVNDWFAPTQLIFARTHQHWDVVATGLPQHDTYRHQGVSP